LYSSGNFASVDLGHYLKQVATQAFRSQNMGAVRLMLDVCQVPVSLDQATPCGLLTNELISNCLKHAFADGRRGEVHLALQTIVESDECVGQWRLQVSDNGVGLPPDFEQRRSQSMGLQLATDLARQIGGVLEISNIPAPGSGTRFRVNVAFVASRAGAK
jgi:two-component sensor histidine kinase